MHIKFYTLDLKELLKNSNRRHFDPDSSGEKSFILYSRKISQPACPVVDPFGVGRLKTPSSKGMPMAEMTLEIYATQPKSRGNIFSSATIIDKTEITDIKNK